MDAATGRLTVREPRVTDRIDMLIDVGEHQNIEMDYVLLLDIRKRANSLAAYRHILAHSLWTENQGYWCALITRGAWAQIEDDVVGPVSGSKAVEPEARAITTDEVREWTAETIILLNDILLLDKQHRPRPKPSQKKRA